MAQDQSLDEHRHRAKIEDVDFLIETGTSKRDACRRVGISVSTYEKRKIKDAR